MLFKLRAAEIMSNFRNASTLRSVSAPQTATSAGEFCSQNYLVWDHFKFIVIRMMILSPSSLLSLFARKTVISRRGLLRAGNTRLLLITVIPPRRLSRPSVVVKFNEAQWSAVNIEYRIFNQPFSELSRLHCKAVQPCQWRLADLGPVGFPIKAESMATVQRLRETPETFPLMSFLFEALK